MAPGHLVSGVPVCPFHSSSQPETGKIQIPFRLSVIQYNNIRRHFFCCGNDVFNHILSTSVQKEREERGNPGVAFWGTDPFGGVNGRLPANAGKNKKFMESKVQTDLLQTSLRYAAQKLVKKVVHHGECG